MVRIEKAESSHCDLIANLGRITFIESHGSSASKNDIEKYVTDKYHVEIVKRDLEKPGSLYHLVYYNEEPVGYSKICFNQGHADIPLKNVTKLERLYILQEFYDKKLGLELFNFNLEISKQQNQSGMWLYVWTGNSRALNFYLKNQFKIIGSYSFPISETHSNPNYRLFRNYN